MSVFTSRAPYGARRGLEFHCFLGPGLSHMGVDDMIWGGIFGIMTVIRALYGPPYKKMGFWGSGPMGISWWRRLIFTSQVPYGAVFVRLRGSFWGLFLSLWDFPYGFRGFWRILRGEFGYSIPLPCPLY